MIKNILGISFLLRPFSAMYRSSICSRFSRVHRLIRLVKLQQQQESQKPRSSSSVRPVGFNYFFLKMLLNGRQLKMVVFVATTFIERTIQPCTEKLGTLSRPLGNLKNSLQMAADWPYTRLITSAVEKKLIIQRVHAQTFIDKFCSQQSGAKQRGISTENAA